MSLKKLNTFSINAIDKLLHNRAIAFEIKKFKDERRKQIYSNVKLSSKQMNEIDEIYINNYGKRIPYTWHQHFTAFTGRFDAKYIPESIYIPEFEKYMNQWGFYADAISDKNFLNILAKGLAVKMPKTIIYRSRGVFHDSENNIISESTAKTILDNIDRKVFCKPSVDTSSGINCFIYDNTEKNCFGANEVFSILGKDFVVQDLVECHERIKQIYNNSVNTFRIITYNWKGTIFHMPIIMRIGAGGNVVDNAHAGGMFIGVSDDGILSDEAYTEFLNRFKHHPDSGVGFKDYRIPCIDKIIKTACETHEAISQIGCINWDFTIDKVGTPILIEANCKFGSIWMIEEAHGTGPFGERTEEILRWLKFMNSLSTVERRMYPFGLNFE